MNAKRPRMPIPEDPDVWLEMAFIAEYLRGRGYDPHLLAELPEELVKELMTEACVDASGKLTAIEARASFVNEVHGVAGPVAEWVRPTDRRRSADHSRGPVGY